MSSHNKRRAVLEKCFSFASSRERHCGNRDVRVSATVHVCIYWRPVCWQSAARNGGVASQLCIVRYSEAENYTCEKKRRATSRRRNLLTVFVHAELHSSASWLRGVFFQLEYGYTFESAAAVVERVKLLKDTLIIFCTRQQRARTINPLLPCLI